MRLPAAIVATLLASPTSPARLDALDAADARPPAFDSTARTTAGRPREFGSWQVGPWVGGARRSPVGALAVTPDRTHLFVGVQALTPILRVGPVRVAYAVQLLPLVTIDGDRAPILYRGPRTPDGRIPGPRRAWAVGLSPFGVELATPQARRVSAFGATAAGGLIFTRPYPVPEAYRINFTLEYGGGVRLRTRGDEWVQLGYKYHHLSNAYLRDVNPGLDAHVWYAGYQWSARLPR